MASNLELLESTDWAATPLGPRDTWPADMHAVLRAVMASGFPVCTVWGPDAIQIYNDGYNPIFGDKHPAAFGRPVRESWPEIWEFLESALEDIRRAGRNLSFHDTLLPLDKHGVPEECYFDFSYSALTDAEGAVRGVMSIAVDKTREVVALRRNASTDLPLDAMEDGIASLADLLRARLVREPMDAAAAAFSLIDARSGRCLPPLWSYGFPDDAARQLGQRIPIPDSGVELRPVPDALATAMPGCPGIVVVPVRGTGGDPLALLCLVPHPLVPVASHREFADLLCDRLHRVVRHAQQLGHARRQLAGQDALYRYLFENVMDAAFYASTDGGVDSAEVVLAANDSACRLLGYGPGELAGVPREALFFPNDAALVNALAARQRERVFDGELTLRRKDGTALRAEVRSHLVEGSEGEVRSVSIVRDLARQQQREAQRAASARFEAIAQLTAGVAHDFNNLLTVVLGSLDQLRDVLPRDSRAHAQASNALLCAERAASLTSQLLSYSRQQPLQRQPVDLDTHLREMEDLLRSSIGETTVLELAVAPELPRVATDPAQLTTALLNLALNARDAMPGGGTIQIQAMLTDDPAFVAVRVLDSGTGIPPDLLERVFEPYFTTKPRGSGTGLGLAMVQGFARQGGGDVRVQSTPGVGTSVELLLPVATATGARAATGDAPVSVRGDGRSVLVVDDNAMVRAQVADLLRDAGYRVAQAANGREALALLATQPAPHLLLTDQVMPGGWSGEGLGHEARRLHPGLPVLLMTGHDPFTRPGEALAFDVVRKPFDRETLLAAIARHAKGDPVR